MKSTKNKNPYILCERCNRTIINLYSFKGFDLCDECYEQINMIYNPEKLTKTTLGYITKESETQKLYFSAFSKRVDVLTNLKKCSQKDFTYTSEVKPTNSYKKVNGVWVETMETPLAFLELQQLQVMIFDEIIKIYHKPYDIVYSIAAKGLKVESCFVHTSEKDITLGNEMFAFGGELIYKTENGIESEIVMEKILAIYGARRSIISEKYSVKFERDCAPIKDWIYYWSFVQTLKQISVREDYTLRDVIESLYQTLCINADKYNYNLEEDATYGQEKKYFNYEDFKITEDLDYSKQMLYDAITFFDLGMDFTLRELKWKRNILLKQYHPDNAGTDMAKYSDFSQKTQMINVYYDLLESVAKK